MTPEQLARILPLIWNLDAPAHVKDALTKPQPPDRTLRLMQEDMLRAMDLTAAGALESHPALGPTWRKTLLHAVARHLDPKLSYMPALDDLQNSGFVDCRVRSPGPFPPGTHRVDLRGEPATEYKPVTTEKPTC